MRRDDMKNMKLYWRIFSSVLVAAAISFQFSLAQDADYTFKPVDSVDCDAIVVGAGSAGVPAAVQIARAGVKTILIESGFQPGGNATTGGVHFPGLFNAWGKQIIAGIGWEWILETHKLGGCNLPDFSTLPGERHWIHQISVNAATYSCVAEDLCLKAGVELRYFESPMRMDALAADSEDSKAHNGANWRVLTSSQGQVREIYCKEAVDCTGNGYLCQLAGAELMREDAVQPGSFFYRLDSGIDWSKADVAAIEKRFQEAIESGELQKEDAWWGIVRFLKGETFNYVFSADSTTGALRTDTDIRGRQSALRMLRFVRTLPGGQNARLVDMSAETGVRETQRVKCLYTITGDDYTSGKVWDDSLAYAFYPVDMHTNEDGVHPKQLTDGHVPTIPLRALVPAGVDHVLVAGRSLGADRVALSGLRVQAACMAGGQAAGAIAAIAVKSGKTPREVDVEAVKELLRATDAIVPTNE